MQHPDDIARLVDLAHAAERPSLLGDARDADAVLPWRNINALLEHRSNHHADQEYLTFVDNEGATPAVTRLSYAQLAERVGRVMAVLQDLGLEAGDTISTVDRLNHADTVCVLLASWCLGLRVAPLNVEEDDQRLAYILTNAGAKAAFVRAAHMEQIERANLKAKLEMIVSMGTAEDNHAYPRLEDLEAAAAPLRLEQDVPIDAEALLVYTSGTTGAPKGVCLSHRLLHDVVAVVDFHEFEHRDVFATAMRLFHVNAIVTSMMAALVAGGRLVLLRRWDPRTFWKLVEDEGVTTTSVVPAMLSDLLRLGGRPSDAALACLRVLICGAGTLKKSLAREWIEEIPVRITHGWGMSETTCWGCWLPHDLTADEYRHLMLGFEAPSIGTPHGFNRMAIFDAEGRALPPREKGQIVVAGPVIMEGYFQRDDANRDTFKHGVLETGDEGFHVIDERGRPMFFITGRIKDIIERGGEKFSPYEMDDDFSAMQGVRSALVYGFPHERLGQEIGVVLEVEEGFAVTPENIWRHAKELGYSWAKAPKEVRVVPSIPKTSTGKETRKLFAELFEGCEKLHYTRPEWWE